MYPHKVINNGHGDRIIEDILGCLTINDIRRTSKNENSRTPSIITRNFRWLNFLWTQF